MPFRTHRARILPLLSVPLLLATLALADPTPATPTRVTPEQAEKLFRAQDWPKAIAAFEYLTQTDPAKGLYWQRLGHCLHAAGRLDEAMPIHEKAATFPDTRASALYNIACIHAMRKQNDDAFRQLNAAFDAGMTQRYYFEEDADLANIRSDPRFAAILQRVTDAERKRDADATQVAVVVHKGVELLDFAGPAEVFAHARKDGRSACHVFTVAPQPGPCVTGQGVTVAPDYTIDNCPRIDILVIPGGATQNLTKDKKFMDWVRTKFPDTKIVMTVCTGAFTLADQGLLDGLGATTHFSAIPGLRRASNKIEVKEGARWVDNGHVVTTAGISAGIDGALQVVSRLYGKEAAHSAAHDMEYDWQPEKRPGVVKATEAAKDPEGSTSGMN